MDDLLHIFYDGDFIGSADVLESLSLNEMSTVLFFEEPTLDDVERFAGVRDARHVRLEALSLQKQSPARISST